MILGILVCFLGPFFLEILAHGYLPRLISPLAFVPIGTFPLLQRPTERRSIEGYRAIDTTHHWPGGSLGGPARLSNGRVHVWIDDAGERATVMGPGNADPARGSFGSTTLHLSVVQREGERVIRVRALPLPLTLLSASMMLIWVIVSSVLGPDVGSGIPILLTAGITLLLGWSALAAAQPAQRSTLATAQRLLYAHFVSIALREAETKTE